jgi:hypothetical protein
MRILAKRIYLQPPILDGRSIITDPDSLIQQLVDDMGGHGRVLEALYEILEIDDIEDYPIWDFMQVIRKSLEKRYPDLVMAAQRLILILIDVITCQSFSGLKENPGH